MKREAGLDLVRFIAIFCVPAVHFFLYNGFYDNKINGPSYVLSFFLLMLFYVGVPLFLLLTGYLKKNKTLNRKYYNGLIKILISYFFISAICSIVRKYVLHDDIRILSTLINIFNFKACGYAWYIEMYIGLFLFIPFLNILYDNLKTKRNKLILILTVMVSCSFYTIINFIKIDGVSIEIVPDFWNIMYPFVYYFIGCYIREYRPKVDKLMLFIFGLSILLFEAFVMYHYYYDQLFTKTFFWTYNSVFVVMLSTVIFLLLYDININFKYLRKFITNISIISLDIYLFSYLVDRFTYSYLDSYLRTPEEYLAHIIPIVLFVFIVSCLLAYIKKYIFVIFQKVFPKYKEFF